MAQIKTGQERRLSAAEKADIKVARVAALDGRTRAGKAVAAVCAVGDQEPMTAASVTVLASGLLFRDRRMIRSGIRMLGALGLATLIKTLIKDNVDRTRPGDAIANRRYRMRGGTSDKGRLRSMPSGHSASVAAVMRATARDYPDAAVPLAVAGVSVAGAQLPSRNHFVSDVAVGVAIGLISEKLVSGVIDRVDARLAGQSA